MHMPNLRAVPRMFTILTTFILLSVVLVHISCKSNDQQVDFIKKQYDKLTKEGVKCPLKKFSNKALDHLRLNTKNENTVVMCILEAMKQKEMQTSGVLWSTLATLYQRLRQKTQATTCFKHAAKIDGKHTAYIKEWSFIGPFVIGKTEVDGDPIEAFDGIKEAAKNRFKKNVKYFSELVPGGEVQWSTVKQTGREGSVVIRPSVNWNELVNSLGSMGITEFQGWLVGEFAVNDNDQPFLVQCLGIHTVLIDNQLLPITGDVYHRSDYWYSVNLDKGLHTIYIRVRSKVQAQLQCKFKTAKSSYDLLQPSFLPDLHDGQLFSSYITFPIVNYHDSKFLQISKIALTDLKSKNEEIKSKLVATLNDQHISIAPGQIYPVVVKLNVKASGSGVVDSDRQVITQCSSPESSWDVAFSLKVTTSAGVSSLPLKIRCRSTRQSFLFTFLDHDGSVQHAAAIQPLQSCPGGVCPTVLTMHGTTISPQNQADGYKHMVDGDFKFGFPRAWTLAPTRHGAHNWEGPGVLTALAALENLAALTMAADWFENKADSKHVVYAGHSMGGHGALHVATHYPDRALALVSLAAWIKKEEYGDSNLFFRHDIASSHVDPAVKAVLESCIVENDADQHATNLRGIPTVTRIGAADRTVHPWFLRRMYRLLQEEEVKVNHTEVKAMEHWWWDTVETNDGGAVNDQYLRDFTNQHIDHYLNSLSDESCRKGSDCTAASSTSHYTASVPSSVRVVCYNPALGEGVGGVRVLQQIKPFTKSEIEVEIQVSDPRKVAVFWTRNVRRFSISTSPNRNIPWNEFTLQIDKGLVLTSDEVMVPMELCRVKGGWSVCSNEIDDGSTRGPQTLGPARRIAEQPFKIVYGTQGLATGSYIQHAAVYIANLFFLTANTLVQVVPDTDVTTETLGETNVIVIGNSSENLHTDSLLQNIPIKSDLAGVRLQDCQFEPQRTGLLSLVPMSQSRLGLVLLGTSLAGLQDVVSLATPTIPPMTRSPFSNLIPDFVITGREFGRKGPGGYLCAGFYGNQWEYRADLSSCACSL